MKTKQYVIIGVVVFIALVVFSIVNYAILRKKVSKETAENSSDNDETANTTDV